MATSLGMQRRYRPAAGLPQQSAQQPAQQPAQPQAQPQVSPLQSNAIQDPNTQGEFDPTSPAGASGGQGGGPQQQSPNGQFNIPGGSSDTSWFNPYSSAVSGQPPSSMPASSTPYYSGSDIAQQFQNNRNVQQNQGDMFQQYFGGQASQRQGAEQAAGAKANQLYGDLEQTPGYTSQEQNSILGNRADGGNNYQDLLNTDYGSNFLTPDEQSQISGNPNDPGKRLNSDILDNVNSTAGNMRSGAISGAQDRFNQNYGTLQSGLNSAVDPSKLNVSNKYTTDSDNVLSATGNKVTSAANNSALGITGEYGRQAGMTDQEVADTAAMGGQAVGAQSRSAIQDLERQAAASGNSDPLAVAAARRQFEDQNAVNSADATVNAQLAARNAQRNAASGVESTRLGAQQYQTGAQISGAEAMGNLAQNAATTQEQLRMQGAQDVSNRQLGIASQLGQVGQENANTLLSAQTANANQTQAGGLQAGQFNQAAQYGAAANAEQNASSRAAAIANNRQNTSQTNQGNQFNRGYQVNAQGSNLQQGIANQRIGGQQQVRNYYTGQQQYQGAQGNQAQQNLLTNRQQTQTGVNQGTTGAANWEDMNKRNPSIGGRVASQAASAGLGAFLGNATGR